MLTKMQKLANELVEVRGKLNEFENTYKDRSETLSSRTS
jgi:hypothetical protein